MKAPFSTQTLLHGRRVLTFAILIGMLALSACAWTQKAVMPPLSPKPTGEHQVGKFVWFDLLTEDVPAAQKFYTGLFGWRYAAADRTRDYTVIYSGDKPIGGMVPYANVDATVLESIWLPALSVEDVDRAVAAAKARHGTVLDGPVDVKGRGRMAVIRDPEGAELVLIHAAGGDPADTGTRAGEFLWVDLFTRDVGKAEQFYGAVAGYSAQALKTKGSHDHNLLRRNGRAYAGMVELPLKNVEPNWLPYIKVDDFEAMMRRAAELGGVVILRGEHAAVIADPAGGVFGIQTVGRERS